MSDVLKEVANEEVFKQAMEQWGLKAQIGMCIEEMGEALTAINHYDRGRIPIEDMIEEFVDVFIMMNQMRYIHKQIFDNIFDKKIQRIRKRLGMKTTPELKHGYKVGENCDKAKL